MCAHEQRREVTERERKLESEDLPRTLTKADQSKHTFIYQHTHAACTLNAYISLGVLPAVLYD